MCVIAVNVNLRKKRKCHSEVDLASFRKSLIALGFLVQELGTRESEYHKIIMRIGIPEVLQSLELWSKTTLGGSIDYEEYFSSVF